MADTKITLKEARKGFSLLHFYETMEDYKEGYLMVWANCMSLFNSIAGLYIEGTRDVISYHGNSQGRQKRPINFSFCKLSVKLIRWPAILISLLESSLSSLTFQTVWKKVILYN